MWTTLVFNRLGAQNPNWAIYKLYTPHEGTFTVNSYGAAEIVVLVPR